MNSESTTDQSRVKQLLNKMSEVRSLLTDVMYVVFTLIAVLIVMTIVFKDISVGKVIIEPIEVPEAPKDGLPVGYTKLTLTRQLLDKAQKINEELQSPIFDSFDESYSLARLSSSSKYRSTVCQNKKSTIDCDAAKYLGSKFKIPPPNPLQRDLDEETDIQVPGTQMSVKSLQRFLRQAFGIDKTYITGEITVTKSPITEGKTKAGNVIQLNLRSNSPKDFQPEPIAEDDIDKVLTKGGMNLLALTHPCALASYFYSNQIEMEEERFNKLIDACLNDSPEVAFYGYLLSGQKAVQQKNFNEAIKQYSKAIKINSESSYAPDWWLALFAQDKLNEINGRSADAYYYWGRALLEQDRPNQADAVDKFNKALKANKQIEKNIDKLNPKQQADTYLLWGNLLLNIASTKNDSAIRDEAFKKFEKVSDLDKQKGATAYVLWGNALLDSKNIDGAIGKYKKAAELQPDYPIAYNNWGIALYEQGNDLEAIAKYKEAVGKNSEYVEPYYNWGLAQMQKGKITDANALFKKVIDNDKNHKFKDVYYLYAITLVNLGKPEEAIPYYEKAEKLYPESADFYNDWGIALSRAATKDKQKLDKAIEHYKKAICIDQTYFYSYYNYGLARQIQGRFADAIMLYQKALETDKKKVLFNKLSIPLDQKIKSARTNMEKSKQIQATTTDQNLLKCPSTESAIEQPKSEDDFAESEWDSRAPIIPKVIIWSVTGGIAVLLTGLLVIFFKRRGDQSREPSIQEPQHPITPVNDWVREEKITAPRRLTQVEECIPTLEPHRQATLLCIAGTMQGRKFPVKKEIFNIGANTQNDLCIPDDDYVSGHHAYLKYEKGSLLIFDPGSRNGTFVNGHRISGTAWVLKPGDRIQIGKESFEVLPA
jgi:tetratricopeptide (TPR) repeat protein